MYSSTKTIILGDEKEGGEPRASEMANARNRHAAAQRGEPVANKFDPRGPPPA